VSDEPLICPGCARTYPRRERFCSSCGMPLVYLPGPERQASARQLKARKIKPQYAEGALVKVARAQNQTEAEFIEGLLLEEGIPCMLRRSRGFDVPDFLAAGPRDVLVPASGAEAAREALEWDEA
jgi:Putative prokaryotic signal transducing protein